ncbi:hypothetical protein EGW08_011441 [Elysia chlorotica]|uniref:Uncharacterized protein n=1 Tax=Elysia chlorotica TaxID=188477 RepID=A0A433TGX5_ELYCH|nr:hypothetical protein EGW08_011441 [Elysia chlorotica]
MDSYCSQFVKSFHMQVLVESYDTADVSTIELDGSTSANLDKSSSSTDTLKTVELDSPLSFNDACIQPACVPNSAIKTDEIDFDDCRMLGYGDTQAGINTPVDRLIEIEVTVDSSSVTEDKLKVTRKTGNSKTGPCMNDFSAPLICSHAVTSEWITVGMTSKISFACDSGDRWVFEVENLLSDGQGFFSGLQGFKYSSRD